MLKKIVKKSSEFGATLFKGKLLSCVKPGILRQQNYFIVL